MTLEKNPINFDDLTSKVLKEQKDLINGVDINQVKDFSSFFKYFKLEILTYIVFGFIFLSCLFFREGPIFPLKELNYFNLLIFFLIYLRHTFIFTLFQQKDEELKKKMKVTKKPRFVGAKDEGDLDSRNLWKIPARRGSDVFEQNNPKFINNVAASILIDISGSLNNDNTKEGKEIKFIAGALSEALQNCFVNHEVLGYHAPYSDELAEMKTDASYNRRNHYLETVVFKNFKQKDNAGIDNLELQSSDNSDGESLRIATKRLLQQRAKNRVLFMITDAKPFLTGSNVLKLDKDLYEALQEAKRKKIKVIGIGFNSDKTGIFGKNFLHIKNNSYEELITGIKNLDFLNI